MAPKKEQGSALLTALFITLLVAVIATAAAYRFRLVAHWVGIDTTTNQLTLYATGITHQASANLETYVLNWNNPSKQRALLTMPSSLEPLTMQDGSTVTATIIDASSLFNINNLSYPNTQQGFINLLSYALPNQTRDENIRMTNNIVDWLSPRTTNNADQLYADLNPPYRAAHRPMQDISELRLIVGITPAIFNALKPYITTIPIPEHVSQINSQPTPININTAPPLVLLATSPEMNIEQAQQLYNCRLEHGIFLTVSDALKLCFDQTTSAPELTGTAVFSNYFFVLSQASHAQQKITVTTLLSTHQFTNNAAPHSYIIWQAHGE